MYYLSNYRSQKFNSSRVQGNWIQMLKVSEIFVDKSFFRRMNSITNAEDAVANEVVYHDIYRVKAKREAQS